MNKIAVSMCVVFVVAGSNIALSDNPIDSLGHVDLQMDDKLVPLKDVSSALQSACSRNLAVD
jgi:hypothetical protein